MIFGLFRVCWVFVWTVCCCEYANCFVLLFGCENMVVTWRTVARSIALAQARLTRPGEICKSRPGLHTNSRSVGELLFWVRQCLAQARGTRLSEKAWKPWGVAAVLAQARGGLAQAREGSPKQVCENLPGTCRDLA